MDLDKKYHVLHLQYYIISKKKIHRNRKSVFESNQNKDNIFKDVVNLANFDLWIIFEHPVFQLGLFAVE